MMGFILSFCWISPAAASVTIETCKSWANEHHFLSRLAQKKNAPTMLGVQADTEVQASKWWTK